MALTLTPEQDDLRAAVRALLVARSPSRAVRVAMDSDAGYDPDLWRRLGTELGVLGLVVGEQDGGAGAGHVERAVVAEELGRALVPAPFLGSAVLAVDTMMALSASSVDADSADAAGDGAEVLAALATGERIGALAVAEPGGWAFATDATATRATRRGGRWVLDGRKTPVVDGLAADVVLVYAATDDGPAFFLVETTAPGLTRTPLRGLDPTRRLARLDLAAVPATRMAGDAVAALGRVAELAAVALGAEQVGGMGRAIELTVDYAKVRVQFGRPIGSYQAVKHGCADSYVAHQLACSALRHAAWAADHDPDQLPEAAAVLAAYAGPAYFAVADAMVQYHGGIGYTWEHDAHLYFKRAKSTELLLGSPARHRARLADLLQV